MNNFLSMKNELSPVLLQPGSGRVLRAFGEEVTLLLGPEHTGGTFTAFLEVTPPGGGPPPHFHEREDEWFYVLEGRVSFLTDGKWTETLPGTTVFAPRRSVHTFKNTGSTASKMLIHTTPSGFEKFFAAAAEEFAKPGGPDMKRAVQIAAEHGIHFV
jgi:quercetin dioxygenase-like cupin family protein